MKTQIPLLVVYDELFIELDEKQEFKNPFFKKYQIEPKICSIKVEGDHLLDQFYNQLKEFLEKYSKNKVVHLLLIEAGGKYNDITETPIIHLLQKLTNKNELGITKVTDKKDFCKGRDILEVKVRSSLKKDEKDTILSLITIERNI